MLTFLVGGMQDFKLLEGLLEVIHQKELTIIVNTINNLEICGLDIYPDLECLLFLLARKSSIRNSKLDRSDYHTNHLVEKFPSLAYLIDNDWEEQKNDTYTFMDTFSYLMDKDKHLVRFGDIFFSHAIFRNYLITQGKTFSEAIDVITEKLDIKISVLPITDSKITLKVITEQESLSFLEYRNKAIKGLIKEIKTVEFTGSDKANVNPKIEETLSDSDKILIGPSFPPLNVLLCSRFLTPLYSIKETVEKARCDVIAINPIVDPIEQPLRRIMEEALGLGGTALQIAKRYSGLIDTLIIDKSDEKYKEELEALGMEVLVTEVRLSLPEYRKNLAELISKLCPVFSG